MAALKYRRPAILKSLAHDRHALIEASAGTGKTRTIEYLVLDLLLATDCSVEQILVLTFTEKATAELRGRIRALLERVLSGAACADGAEEDEEVEIGEPQRRKIETALFSFDRAPINTIHAFCQRVLTDLAFDSGSGFHLELIEARLAFHRAFREELRERAAADETIRGLLGEWLTAGDSPARVSQVDSLESLLYEAHFHRYLDTPALRRNLSAFAELSRVFDPGLLRQACSAVKRKSRERLAAADALARLVAEHRTAPETLRAALAKFDFESLADLAKIAGRSETPASRRVVDAIDAVRIASSLQVRVVDAMLPLVTERLARNKRETATIDYADMLALVWRALEGPRGDALTAWLRARFKYGLIDEFQDTDDLQWKIFQRIFVESGGQNFLYLVGDPKQAIYGFRGADVFTYLQARSELFRRGITPAPLTRNFRSTPRLIEALNEVLRDNANAPIFSGEISVRATGHLRQARFARVRFSG